MTVKVSTTIKSLRVRDVMAANVMAAELMPTAADRVRAHSLTPGRACYSSGPEQCLSQAAAAVCFVSLPRNDVKKARADARAFVVPSREKVSHPCG